MRSCSGEFSEGVPGGLGRLVGRLPPHRIFWTFDGFVPVTNLIMPPWPRMRADGCPSNFPTSSSSNRRYARRAGAGDPASDASCCPRRRGRGSVRPHRNKRVRGHGFRVSFRSAGMTACSLSRSDDLDLQQPFLIEKSADDHRDRGFARAQDLISDGAVLYRVLAV